jgi:polysaccharide biosynthesis PFTS motif protein
MKIDEHWVWTEKHKSYLKHFTRAQILVKKSLMFYEPERQKTLNNTFDVVIFDVTPKKDVNISNFSIYTTDEMIRFITEILECVELIKAQFTLEVRVALKHKREFARRHNTPEYSQFIRSKIKNKEISIVDSNQNLYDLIQSSKLIIGFPCTSPVIIGQELKKPSVFYCSSDLLKLASKSESQSFLQSEKSLYAYMKKVLVN